MSLQSTETECIQNVRPQNIRYMFKKEKKIDILALLKG